MGSSSPLIWPLDEGSHYCHCTPHPLITSGIWNMRARFGGSTSRSTGLPHCLGSLLHLQLLSLSTWSVLGPLMAAAIEHLLPTQAVLYWGGLGYHTHPRISLANCSLPLMRYVPHGWTKHFPLKFDVPALKGMTTSFGVATRNSW